MFDLSKDISETVDRTTERSLFAQEEKARWDRWGERNIEVRLKDVSEKKEGTP